MSGLDREARWDALRFGTLLLLLVACFALGGASRVDVISLIILQPLSVICTAIFLAKPSSIRWDAIKFPLLVLCALALIMVAQLIPLPPEIWTSLPGHHRFAMTAEIAGIAQPWRPISLSPDLTLSSIVSLTVPFAVLIGFASVSTKQSQSLLVYVIAGITISAFIGLAQVAGGGRGALYFYQVTNLGSPVGLFANRNHQAVMLAAGLPMLALWAVRSEGPTLKTVRPPMAMAIGLAYLPLILVSGSRAGLLLAVIGLAGAAFFLASGGGQRRQSPRFKKLVVAGVGALAVGIVAVALFFSRNEALERLANTSVGEESRLTVLPTIARMVADFAPVGAGFGGFDPLFRVYEPTSSLGPRYLNHAHNDLLEFLLAGGLPALVVLVAGLIWFVRAATKAVRDRRGGSSLAFARLGLILIGMLLLGSLVDYPLRTPLLAALFAIASCWISDYLVSDRSARRNQQRERALPSGLK